MCDSSDGGAMRSRLLLAEWYTDAPDGAPESSYVTWRLYALDGGGYYLQTELQCEGGRAQTLYARRCENLPELADALREAGFPKSPSEVYIWARTMLELKALQSRDVLRYSRQHRELCRALHGEVAKPLTAIAPAPSAPWRARANGSQYIQSNGATARDGHAARV